MESEAVLTLPDDPPPMVAMHVYRLVQEMLANAVKHSGGKRMTLHLVQEGEEKAIPEPVSVHPDLDRIDR